MANSSCNQFLALQNNTLFTVQQLKDYCLLLTKTNTFKNTLGDIVNTSQWVAGIIGIISYIVMFFTLTRTTLKGCTLIYYQTITITEFVHMIILLVSGLINSNLVPMPYDTSYFAAVWYYQLGIGWVFGDAIKLMVTTLILFMTMERFVAIWFPSAFQKINRTSVAWSVVAFCSVQGCICGMSSILAYYIQYDPKQGVYTQMATSFKEANDAIVIGLYFVYAVFSVAILLFCLLTVAGLVKKMKRLTSMTISNHENQEWKNTIALSLLSMILGVSMFINHMTWIIFSLLKMYSPATTGNKAVMTLSYEEALANLVRADRQVCWRLAQNLTGEFVGAGRFLIFVCFSKTIRNGFLKLFRKGDNKVTSMAVMDGKQKSTMLTRK